MPEELQVASNLVGGGIKSRPYDPSESKQTNEDVDGIPFDSHSSWELSCCNQFHRMEADVEQMERQQVLTTSMVYISIMWVYNSDHVVCW